MDKVIAMLEQVAQGNQDLRQVLDTKLSVFDDRLRRMEQRRSSPIAPSEPSEPEEPAPKRKQELDDHRTAPHKLILLWPSVRPLLQEANVDVNDGYVMEAEDRGVYACTVVAKASKSKTAHSLVVRQVLSATKTVPLMHHLLLRVFGVVDFPHTPTQPPNRVHIRTQRAASSLTGRWTSTKPPSSAYGTAT